MATADLFTQFENAVTTVTSDVNALSAAQTKAASAAAQVTTAQAQITTDVASIASLRDQIIAAITADAAAAIAAANPPATT